MEQRNEHVFFSNGGLELEGVVSIPAGYSVRPGVVVCHPHPLYGGDLYNNVVGGVAATLVDAGYAVLRFNFRGVHQSEGCYGGGVGEVDDALSAVRYLAEREFVDPENVALAGYSFGAWIGLKAALRSTSLRALVEISPPLSVYDFGAVGEVQVPILLASGEDDHLCRPEALESLYHMIKSPKECCVFPDSDHFFAGCEARLGECVQRFLSCHL